MPDLTTIELKYFLPWLLTGAGLVFYATWLSIALKHLREPGYYDKQSPYVKKLSIWVEGLDPIQMQTLSVVAFFVPVVLAQILVLVVPIDWYDTAAPYVRLAVLSFLAYSGQQWIYQRSK